MKVLIAEDDAVSRRILEKCVSKWGYEVLLAEDGLQAWEIIQGTLDIGVSILDWMMPGLDGTELCRRIRLLGARRYTYVIMLTAKVQHEDLLAGLSAGADDYLTKPFDHYELRLRLVNGERIVRLEGSLAAKIEELQHALRHVDRLQGMLPICMDCKKVRDDGDYWQHIDHYLIENTDADITHSLCPECLAKRCDAVDDREEEGQDGIGVQNEVAEV